MTIGTWSKKSYVHFPCCHNKPDFPKGVSEMIDWTLTPMKWLTCPQCGSEFLVHQSLRGYGINWRVRSDFA